MEFDNLRLLSDRVELDAGPIFKVAHLDKVDGVGIEHRSHPILILLALLAIGFGAWQGFDGMTGRISGVVGGGFILSFFVTRQTMLAIYAGALVLGESVGGAERKTAREFADAVVTAVEQREAGRNRGP